MIFENDILKLIDDKKKYNDQISRYFYRLYCESTVNNKYFNLANRVKDCLNIWVWDAYHKNFVLDLQKVNRCKCRFCSNCRKFDLSRALNNLELPFKDLILRGYSPFLITLTVPNCSGDDLPFVVDKLQKSFKKFYNFYSCDDKKGYFDRYMRFDACVRCLEITYNLMTNMYHPHYHVLVFSFDYNPVLFDKKYVGEWSNKRQSYNMYSDIDMQVRELWTISYNNLTIRDIKSLESSLICDIRECDDKGVFEVMKYSIKDTDIVNYDVFKNLYFGLYNRRIRQGYGLLYNLKLENESSGKEQDLEQYLKVKESPSQLVTTDMKTLYKSTYSNYIKLSRFNKDKFVDRLE
mgnify:CR=1 FL=1|jgi:plasmid rolling circle replication initiator protein Rep